MPKNTLYFRPIQEHVHRPHHTPFHCHQLFPKHFGNHQPNRAQPDHTLETKKWVHIFCLIVPPSPPCDIKTFYAVRVCNDRKHPEKHILGYFREIVLCKN